jgi:hypothetical protein
MRLHLIIRPEAEAELAEAFHWYERRFPAWGGDAPVLQSRDILFS